MSATATLDDALASACGSAHVRGARVEDMIGGITPRLVVEPGDEAEVAALLRACTAAGAAVVPRGGGKAPAWGPPPPACAVVLSTPRLGPRPSREAPTTRCGTCGAGRR